MTSSEPESKESHSPVTSTSSKSPRMSSLNHNNAANSLGPFGVSSLGMGFGLYRPRRPSYTFATQQRQRSESYRCATRREYHDSSSDTAPGEDFIEDVLKHRRKISYTRATNDASENVQMPCLGVEDNVNSENTPAPDFPTSAEMGSLTPVTEKSDTSFQTSRDGTENSRSDENRMTHINMDANVVARIKLTDIKSLDGKNNFANAHRILPPPEQVQLSGNFTTRLGHNEIEPNGSVGESRAVSRRNMDRGMASLRKTMSETLRFNKNLVILSISFILIFSSFQAIQNLQSSLNTKNSLGTISMMLVHVSMIFACLIAPTVINLLTAKWALCLGVLCFLVWFSANFYPKFYTLVPSAVFVGLGQGIVWSAESSYIQKLAFDWAKITRASVDEEMFRFHGIFLACFQTTHLWGNLISSLWLSQQDPKLLDKNTSGASSQFDDFETWENVTSYDRTGADWEDMSQNDGELGESPLPVSRCGALFRCEGPDTPLFHGSGTGLGPLSGVLWKLMIFYVLFGVIAFILIIFLLDHIGARADPGKNPKQIIKQHTSQLLTHRTLRLLIPLLLFNGMQQGFMYSDYNHYFVTCSLGIDYVGYCMITLGVANVLGAVFVTLFAHRIPREVILGFGGILHIALMIGYLIWIPEQKPVLFCVLAAAWGLCDAVWQTQCNTLICLTCVEEPDVAFTNYRLVQSVGLALVFGLGSWVCVSVKLYMLMTLLVLAIMFYVLAEYQLRHSDDDLF